MVSRGRLDRRDRSDLFLATQNEEGPRRGGFPRSEHRKNAKTNDSLYRAQINPARDAEKFQWCCLPSGGRDPLSEGTMTSKKFNCSKPNLLLMEERDNTRRRMRVELG
ncbi:hypothetical protein KM043_011920 [Ampulex compressa]|nr:hypothetical protein KM043_011920 [Ampulex compressa]